MKIGIKNLAMAQAIIENEKFEGHQLESINYVEDIIKNNGGLILENLDQIAEFLNNKC